MLDRLRAKAFAAVQKLPGKAGELALKANEALGRPLANEAELEDRKAFASGRGNATVVAQPAPQKRDQAPVIVYAMDKTMRDVPKLTDVLDQHGVAYTVTNIQEDAAAQYAVRRDSNGARLPVCFIAGDCVGGRAELVNLASSGELKRKVFG